MTDTPITPNEMAACVEREVAMRLRVYPRWVQAGKMRPEKAAREIAVMKAVAALLKRDYPYERPNAPPP